MAIIRCYDENMARKVIRDFNNNNDIYGKKYTLKIRDYHDIYLL